MYGYRTPYRPRRPKRSSKPNVLAQGAGAWRHLWRVGRYANVSIADPQEQNGILSSLPLFPFMDMRITPLCRQPSSVHDDYR